MATREFTVTVNVDLDLVKEAIDADLEFEQIFDSAEEALSELENDENASMQKTIDTFNQSIIAIAAKNKADNTWAVALKDAINTLIDECKRIC